MAVICLLRYSTKLFHWDKETRTLTAEASDLERFEQIFDRIWDDAADEGFTLVSHHTGRQVTFVITVTEYTPDRDIAGWWLKPVRIGARDVQDIRVHVIND